jgi:dTDP-4-dehydrorhamnose reductase
MKVLVTGAGGMLGKALVPCLEARGHKVRGMPREELDITNYAQVAQLVAHAKPDIVVHPAAYTKVDQAESEPELAHLINGYGTENLAVACNAIDVPLLYVSTDYVFDGEQNRPYYPWDQTRPLSVYGKSKLAGETAVTNHLNSFYIVRTSWLYGPHGKNFVETIIKLAEERDVLKVVSDQFGSPTSTLTLSETIADLIDTGRWGIYHATDGGITTWYEFARAIVQGKNVQVIPIDTTEFPRPATRPKYSGLDKTTLIHTIGREMVPWQEALNSYLNLRLQMQPA